MNVVEVLRGETKKSLFSLYWGPNKTQIVRDCWVGDIDLSNASTSLLSQTQYQVSLVTWSFILSRTLLICGTADINHKQLMSVQWHSKVFSSYQLIYVLIEDQGEGEEPFLAWRPHRWPALPIRMTLIKPLQMWNQTLHLLPPHCRASPGCSTLQSSWWGLSFLDLAFVKAFSSKFSWFSFNYSSFIHL